MLMAFKHMKDTQTQLLGKCQLEYIYIEVHSPIMWAKVQKLDNGV